MDRLDKYNYYLDIAESVSKRGTCLRKRYGAVINLIIGNMFFTDMKK